MHIANKIQDTIAILTFVAVGLAVVLGPVVVPILMVVLAIMFVIVFLSNFIPPFSSQEDDEDGNGPPPRPPEIYPPPRDPSIPTHSIYDEIDHDLVMVVRGNQPMLDPESVRFPNKETDINN